jgi:hypothetical protein
VCDVACALLLEQVERRAMAAQVDPQEWRERFDEWLMSEVDGADPGREELLSVLGLRG